MIKRLITTILILTVLVPAVPFRHACDANRDNRIDLSDVIVNMRNLAQSATEPHDFKAELGNAITAIRNVAGLNRIISTDDASTKATTGANHVYLVSFIDVTPVVIAMYAIGDSPVPYQSIERPPIHGPPRNRA
jgi:hypothetical protein